MLDSAFVETMSRAISDYRQILKKYLSPEQRSAKIAQLRLKDPTIFNDELALYQAIQEILRDIEKNIQIPNEGYYSYYGILRFEKFLREYIENFTVDGGMVIHKAQKASNVLIKVIQLLSLPREQLTAKMAQQIIDSHPLIIEMASKEQLSIYVNTLDRLSEKNNNFYQKIADDFRARTSGTLVEAA